ncbi:MAG TPA: DUF58 domain-containing protein, partial [Actinomycetes bacterium]|nr:DUF58 domain-containing protein [Actinomycetes bacterium]
SFVWGLVGVQWLLFLAGWTFFAHPSAILMGGLLLSTRVVAHLTRPRLSDLQFEFAAAPRCTDGDLVSHQLFVKTSRIRWSGALEFTLSSAGFSTITGSLSPQPPTSQATVELSRRAFWRAHTYRQDLSVTMRDRLGLSITSARYEFKTHVVIEPQLVEVDLPRTRWLGGDDDGSRADRMGVQPFAVRPWRSGDSTRQVHWRSTARKNEPIVVERAVPHEPRLALLIVGDGHRPASEYVVSHLASYGLQGLRAGNQVMLLGIQSALPIIQWATRDELMDWCTAIEAPSVMDRTALISALRAAGPGSRVVIWTSLDMTADWWTYLELMASQFGVELLSAHERLLVPA